MRIVADELQIAVGGHFALKVNTKIASDLHQIVDLHIDPEGPPRISFRFSAADGKNCGIAQCTAIWIENGVSDTPIGQNRFFFTYAEPEGAQQRRFEEWMEAALVDGLQKWRATLAT